MERSAGGLSQKAAFDTCCNFPVTKSIVYNGIVVWFYSFAEQKSKMPAGKNKYKSVNLTRFYMKCVGLWRPESERERIVFNCALVYAVFGIVFAIGVEGVDLYHCYHDFQAVMDNLGASILLVMILIKFSNFIIHRDVMFELISYAEKNFWQAEYDEYGANIVDECDRKGVLVICTFTILVQIGTVNYIYVPLIENRGRNETDRVLPFKLYVDLPLTTTPYYEIAYTIQSLSTLYSGLCTFCFDNFLYCFNIHVAGQLKILAHKFETMSDACVDEVDEKMNSHEATRSARDLLPSCIRDHLKLIEYVDRMEQAFTWILLGQMLISSIVICIGVFQFLNATTLFKRFIQIPICVGSIAQLFLYSWTCNDITYQSEMISRCAYNMKWYLLPHDENGKTIKQGILMVMCKLRQPCVLTGGKFAPISLETFKNLFSTAASYLTILQQMSDEIA